MAVRCMKNDVSGALEAFLANGLPIVGGEVGLGAVASCELSAELVRPWRVVA